MWADHGGCSSVSQVLRWTQPRQDNVEGKNLLSWAQPAMEWGEIINHCCIFCRLSVKDQMVNILGFSGGLYRLCCHYLTVATEWKQLCSVVQSCGTLQPHGLNPARLFCPWDSPGKNTGVDWHFLLRGIFLTQGSNPSLLRFQHWQTDALFLSHLGKWKC